MHVSEWAGVIVAVVFSLGAVAPAWAQEKASPSEKPAASEKREAPEKKEKSEPGYVFGGAVLTVLNIPLRGALCAASTGVATGLFVVTFGTAGHATATIVKEACGGPWIITPEVLKGKPPKESD